MGKSAPVQPVTSNEQGNSILQVMVVMGVIGVIAVATLQMANTTKKGAEGAIQYGDAKRFFARISMLLRDETSCRTALGGPAVMPSTLPYPASSHPQAYDTTNLVIYDNGTSANPQAPLYSVSSPVGRLKIQSMSLTPTTKISDPTPTTGTRWLDYLDITLSKSAGLIGASTVSSKRLPVIVMVDGSNNVISCTSMVYGSAAAPSAFPICQIAQSIYYDGSQVTCVNSICPVGKTPVVNQQGVTQVDASGNIQCQ